MKFFNCMSIQEEKFDSIKNNEAVDKVLKSTESIKIYLKNKNYVRGLKNRVYSEINKIHKKRISPDDKYAFENIENHYKHYLNILNKLSNDDLENKNLTRDIRNFVKSAYKKGNLVHRVVLDEIFDVDNPNGEYPKIALDFKAIEDLEQGPIHIYY